MKLHRLRIIEDNENVINNCKAYLDDNELLGVTNIKFEIDVNDIPSVIITMYCKPENIDIWTKSK